MNPRRAAVVLGLVACGAVAVAVADSFSDAERAADKLKSGYEDLKKLTVSETARLVTSICDAEEADRKSVAKEASDRVQSKVKDEYEDLEDLKDDALAKIKIVLDDHNLKDKHSKTEDLKEDVEKRWASIGKMTTSLRGANHPVVSWMIQKGQDAHKSRQESSSHCDVSEFSMSSGRVDCLKASGSTCTVIELKPKNSRAISAGRDQALRYARELNKLGEDFENLKKRDSDFKECKKFEDQVDCYTLCPEIDSDGDFRSTSASWSTDC